METEQILKDIENKEIELFNLKSLYNDKIEEERVKILKSKSEPLVKTFYLLNFNFASSSSRTPQYLQFHRVFKREFTQFLKSFGIQEIDINKPNHFDINGFFKYKEQCYYFSISDLRWSKDFMLRTAKGFKDYTGGSITFLSINSIEEFKRDFKQIVRVER